jgi:hypothetical protein
MAAVPRAFRGVMGRGFLAYSRWRMREIGRWMDDPAGAQERLLLALTRTAARTAFGRDYDFRGVRSVADFQRRVPLAQFRDRDAYWRRVVAGEPGVVWPGRIPLYAITSGSTGAPKLVPVSREGLRGFLRAGRDILSHYLVATGDAEHFRGQFLYLGGSRELAPDASGATLGDLSGIVAEETPWIYKPFRLPSPAAHAIADWDAKLEAVAAEAWNADVRAVSGIPSWLLALFERVLARRRAQGLAADSVADAWPNLSLIVPGGVSFEPYRALFRELIGKPFHALEVYVCSEGFLAIQDRPESPDLLLRMDAGVFHEFVPVEELRAERPTRHWAGTVETGVEYALALTTASGVWATFLGDTVRFESLRPHRIRFAGRTEQFVNAFGEHLRAGEIEAALVAACAATNASAVECHVAPLYPTAESRLRGHEWFVEFARPPDDEGVFVRVLDDTLRTRNVDYDEHRRGGVDFAAPRLVPVARGTFRAAMQREGRSGGQHKIPRTRNDRSFAASLAQAGALVALSGAERDRGRTSAIGDARLRT